MSRLHITSREVGPEADWRRAFGAGVRKRRMHLRLSARLVARFCGVDRASLGHWERGVAVPRPWHLYKLAECLYTTTDELCKYAVEHIGERAEPIPGRGKRPARQEAAE